MEQQKVKDKNIYGVNTYINDNKDIIYCSKCLKAINVNDKDTVRDNEGSYFCDSSCRKDFWLENRQDYDDIVSEFNKGVGNI